MMDFGLPPRKKSEPPALQLTSLVDIITMIVIFLIFGTYFGGADINIPNGIKVPWSTSQGSAELAPRLVVWKDRVELSLAPGEFVPMAQIRELENSGTHPVVQKIKEYLVSRPAELKGPVFLNVIADQDLPYEFIFEATLAFRKLGFTQLMFLTEGSK